MGLWQPNEPDIGDHDGQVSQPGGMHVQHQNGQRKEALSVPIETLTKGLGDLFKEPIRLGDGDAHKMLL